MTIRKPWLLIPAWLLLTATARADCWRMMNETKVLFNDDIPCGYVNLNSPVYPCCNVGDLCLQDDICQTTLDQGASFSGYYLAGCTDPTYNDPACSPYCRDLHRQDVVYNSTSHVWVCCGTEADGSTVNCAAPINQGKEIFSGPAPANLTATFSLGSTTVTGTPTSSLASISKGTPTITSGSTSLSTSTPFSSQTHTSGPVSPGSASSSSSGGLSSGAKAGIGVGVALVAFAALVGAIFFARKWKTSRTSLEHEYMPAEKGEDVKEPVSELGTTRIPRPAEMDAGRN